MRSFLLWQGKVKGYSVPHSFMYFFPGEDPLFSLYRTQDFCWLFWKLDVRGVSPNYLQLRASSNLKAENNTQFHWRGSINQTSSSVGRFEAFKRWSEALFHLIRVPYWIPFLVINIYDVLYSHFLVYIQEKLCIFRDRSVNSHKCFKCNVTALQQMISVTLQWGEFAGEEFWCPCRYDYFAAFPLT